MRPWSTTGLLARDVRDPLSLGSVHVTDEMDLRAVGPWSRATLYAVVEEAAPLERVVVLDYGREHLYVAADATRTVDGPALLTEPPLTVDDPLLVAVEERRGDRGTRTTRNTADGGTPPAVSLQQFRSAIEVAPPFDVLVPAFDLPEDREPPPPTDPGPTRQPTGHETGTPM